VNADLAREIRRFIRDELLFGEDDPTLTARDSLLARGVIDSTGVLELVTFLESHFGIHVVDEELVPENLDSIENIVRFVERKSVLQEAQG